MIQAGALLTTHEVAERLNVNDSRVRQLLLAGQLRGQKAGKQLWLVPESEVDRYQNAHNHKILG